VKGQSVSAYVTRLLILSAEVRLNSDQRRSRFIAVISDFCSQNQAQNGPATVADLSFHGFVPVITEKVGCIKILNWLHDRLIDQFRRSDLSGLYFDKPSKNCDPEWLEYGKR
jgi:hypothetical protein